jgi:phosphohistidine phosphatase SixA
MVQKRFDMRYITVACCLIVIAVVATVVWRWFYAPATTVLLVRHAEPAAQATDPPLSDVGQARAQTLVHVAGDAGVAAIYATQYVRTQQTVQPLAQHLGLPIHVVAANDVQGLANEVRSDHAGEVVVIAGHSNTVPEIIVELGGDPVFAIAGDEYDNLFVVTICRLGSTRVIHLRYGEPS